MTRLVILAIVFYIAFRLFLWLFRMFVLPFLQPRPPHSQSPSSTSQQQQPSIDPGKIQDAKFIDLPPDVNDESK